MAADIGTYTAWSSSGSLASILKEFYLGPVVEELNQEVMVLQLFEKATVDWNGRLCHIPVHTGRNTAVEFLAEGAPFATAQQQQWRHLTVRAHFLYGHFQISGPAIASAKAGGKGAFIGWMEAEMTRLVDDVKNLADATLISGGSCIGYLTADFNSIGAANWSFDGDFAKATDAIAPAGTGNVRVARQDSPGFLADGTTERNANYLDDITAAVAINSVDEAGGTINLAALDTTATASGFGLPVYLTGADATATDTQPRGILANLSETTVFGLNRAGTAVVGATNELPAMQCLVMTAKAQNTEDANERDDLSAERMQQVIDEVAVLSGKEPDCILCHPTVRANYVAMMTTANSLQTTTRGGATKGDVGFLDLSYQNIPLKYGRHVPRGLMFFLNTKSWKIAELQGGSFADLDGSTLNRTGSSDEWNGYYRWYYNLVCVQPNCNAVLCGISLS